MVVTYNVNGELKNVVQNSIINNERRCECDRFIGAVEIKKGIGINSKQIFTFKCENHTITHFRFNIISINPFIDGTIQNVGSDYVNLQIVNPTECNAPFNIQYIMYVNFDT